MTKEDKRAFMLEVLQNATKIVEGTTKPYSDKAWSAFVNKVSEMMHKTHDEGHEKLTHWVYLIMTETMETADKELTGGVADEMPH